MYDVTFFITGFISTVVLVVCLNIKFYRWLDKKIDNMERPQAFLFIILIFFTLWTFIVVWVSYNNYFGLDLSHLGEWGDSFGFLTALFTGLGLFFLLKTLIQHDEAMNDTIEAMNDTRRAMLAANKLKLVETKLMKVTADFNKQERLDKKRSVCPSFKIKSSGQTARAVETNPYAIFMFEFYPSELIKQVEIVNGVQNQYIELHHIMEFAVDINQGRFALKLTNENQLLKVFTSEKATHREETIVFKFINSLGQLDQVEYLILMDVGAGNMGITAFLPRHTEWL